MTINTAANKNKTRVLVVTNAYPTPDQPGDTPCIKDQLDALKEEGICVDLLYIDRRNKINYLKTAWKIWLLNFQPKCYDLVHAYYGHSGLLARLQLRYPVIVTFRGSDLLGGRDGIIGKTAARLVEGVIVMTEQMKQASRRDDAVVIPFGVNLKIFKPYPAKETRAELELPKSKELVLFPWNPKRPEKRYDIISMAVKRMKETLPDVELVVVFDKPHQEMAKYMSACDALVLASDYEGSPMAIREALACGLPIVSVDVGDVRTILEGLNNSYIARQDAEDIANKTGEVLKRNIRENPTAIQHKISIQGNTQYIINLYDKIMVSSQ